MSMDGNIKTRIKAILDSLVPTTLKEVIVDDLKHDPFDRDITAFPAAIIFPAAVNSNAETNRDNVREFTYEVIVMQKGENLASVTDIEDLRETILDAFDNDPTLNGTASAGLLPAAGPPGVVVARGGSYVAFHLSLRCKAIKVLTY